MKKRAVLVWLTGAGMMLALSGCGTIQNGMRDQMMKQSGVLEDSNYRTYSGYLQDERIDEKGLYSEAEEKNEEKKGIIRVTFAKNDHIKTQFYADKEKNVPLQNEVYLNPGDSIYADVEVSTEKYGDIYAFSGFKIYSVDEKEGFKATDQIPVSDSETAYVLTIPQDYSGTELSVEPVGEYHNKKISLSDYCVDNRGNKTELSGIWMANEKECDSDSIEISPASPYIVSYKYDSENYFFVSSEPKSFYNNNTDGTVIFKQQEPTDPTTDYSVELHEYLTISLVSDRERKIIINGGKEQSKAANMECQIPKLRYGQTVVIETDKAWPDLENSSELILNGAPEDSEKWTGGYKYTMVVPEKDGKFLFDPSEYRYQHGTVSFKCFGSEVTRPLVLARGSKIYFEQKSAEDGYWLAPDHEKNMIVVGEEEETKNQLKAIHFTPKVHVVVDLKQPKNGGTVTYNVDGKKIDSNTYSAYSGTVITMDFEPWEGWILNSKAHDGDPYRVTDERYQAAMGPGYEIDDKLFSEDPEHKPALTVTLEKNIGEAMNITLSAAGFQSDDVHYGGGWHFTDVFDKNAGKYDLFSNSQEIISEQKIGTESPIKLTMGNRAIQNGKAVRIRIEKTDSAGNVEEEIRYITDMTKMPETIDVYNPDEISSSKKWYKSIHLTIGVVDVERVSIPVPAQHTAIQLRDLSTNILLKEDDIIEGTQKVAVSILPEPGYYIAGKKTTNDIYQDTMEYSEYAKTMGDIVANHPAEKYYLVHLDASDSFANYSYQLEGEPVSGDVLFKEGQKLTLDYEITDPNYKLKDGAGGVPFIGLFQSFTEVSKDVSMTLEMYDQLITKDDFGIEVVKGE